MLETATVPTEEQIRQRAYEIYLSRGSEGDEISDWLMAERELIQSMKQKAAPQESVPKKVRGATQSRAVSVA